MLDPEINELNKVRSRLRAQRDQIKDYSLYWKDFTVDEDEFKRVTSKSFLRLHEIFQHVYTKLEEFYILNSALKSEIDDLNDFIDELPDVRSNPYLLDQLEKMRDEHNKKYASQLESFMKQQPPDEI